MLKKIIITICEDCLNGIGEMCHNPGCALCRHKVDLPIPPEMYEVLEPDASQSAVEADAESRAVCSDCSFEYGTKDCIGCEHNPIRTA